MSESSPGRSQPHPDAGEQAVDFVDQLLTHARRRRVQLAAGAPPEAIEVSAADLAKEVEARGLSTQAVLIADSGAVTRMAVADVNGWPDGVLAAADLSWLVEGEGAVRTLVRLG